MTSRFAIITRSVFENVYIVEAESEEQARGMVEIGDEVDFYQKHLGESVIHSSPADETAAKEVKAKGYI